MSENITILEQIIKLENLIEDSDNPKETMEYIREKEKLESRLNYNRQPKKPPKETFRDF